MEDLHLVDCVEKIRAYCLEEDPELGSRLARLHSTDFRNQPNTFFKTRLVALALGIEDDTPAGRRQLQREVSRGELASHFPGSSPSTNGLEHAGAYPAASPKLRTLLASSLAALDGTPSCPPFADLLAREAGLAGAARLVSRNLPVLQGRKAYAFLVDCGYPAAVPAGESIRFLYRLGLLRDTASRGGQAGTQRSFLNLVERMARAAGAGMGELDLLLSLFSGARKSRRVRPMCAKKPRCAECPISSYCAHFRFHPPEEVPRTSVPIKEWSVDERPRERLLAGGNLSNAELLAILLRTGTGGRSALDLARQLLQHFGSLHRLAAVSPSVLRQVPGIGPAKAAEIAAALELGRRTMQPEADERTGLRSVTSSRDVFDYFRPRYKSATQEEFLLLSLNTKNRITREISISVGTLNSSIVHPRDVFKAALEEAAAAVIFVHNHPSGDPAPSQEDRTLTSRLCEAGRLLGIKVLDHVIVGATRYYSFADEGALG